MKRAYGDEISGLARDHITFLPAFRRAFERLFTESNIRANFRGAEVVLYDLGAVLLILNVKLRTLTPALSKAI